MIKLLFALFLIVPAVAPEPHDARTVHQHDQVVADAFEVGDEVGGEDHAGVVLGDRFHQMAQEAGRKYVTIASRVLAGK